MTELECRRVLGLQEIYTLREAKNAYRKMVLETHPDRNRGDNTKFLLVNKAYEEIQIHLQYKNRHTSEHQTKQTYQNRSQAEKQYKTKVKNDIYWKKYSEAKKKRYDAMYKENLKIGCLLVAIVILLCVYLGKKFDPEFNGTKNKTNNHE